MSNYAGLESDGSIMVYEIETGKIVKHYEDGLEIMRMDDELVALKGAFERISMIQWVPETGECIADCGGDSISGHTDDCELGKALKEIEMSA